MTADPSGTDAGPSTLPVKRRKHKQRFNRSKTGCLSCRRRRIRCDEVHPICERCSESKTACEWPEAIASSRTSRTPSISHTTTPNHGGGHGSALPMSQGLDWSDELMNEHGFDGNDMLRATPPATSGIRPVNPNNASFVSTGQYDVGITQSDAFHNAFEHQPLNPLFNFSAFPNTVPWATGALVDGSTLVDPSPVNPASGISLLDLFAPDATAGTQNPSRQATPPLPRVSAAPPSLRQPPTALSLSASSVLASRRRVGPAAIHLAHTMPVTIPPTIDEPLEHVFPSAGSKQLFHHVKSKTSTIIVALGTGNHQSKNPFMAMATRLMLIDPTSHAQTAFRHSLLSLASAHVAHQYRRTSPVQCQEMRVRTAKSKRKAMMFLSMDQATGGYTDLLLATCLTLFLRNKLYADDAWRQSLDAVVAHITRCAGPVALLATSDLRSDRRFLLEQIAVADLFSTFTTGKEPRLLGQGANWWGGTASTATETQWESYERFLGISRDMTEMLARYRILLARYRQLEEETWLQGKAAAAVRDQLTAQAEAMIETLRSWSADEVNVPARKRIKSGDSAYRYMMVISLSTEVLSLDESDNAVQAAVHSILELCSEMSREPLNLLWPLMTAGACAGSEANRSRTGQLFDLLGDGTCKDVDIARDVLQEQCIRMDCGNGFTPWPVIMKDLRVEVCLV